MIRPRIPADPSKFLAARSLYDGWNDPNAIGAASGASAAAPTSSDINATPGYGAGGNLGTVDLSSLITQDPFYRQQNLDLDAGGIADAAQRAANIRATLVNWGIIPDLSKSASELGLSDKVLGYLKSDVDPMTQELARKNNEQGLSVSAQLDKNNTDNIRNIRNALAARGMYQSGELGHGLTENEQNYKIARTEGERQALGALSEAVGSFLTSEQERSRQRGEYAMDAASRAAELAGSGEYGGYYGPSGGNTSSPAPAQNQIGWDASLGTPIAGPGLPAGTYTVNGQAWTYDPSSGWRLANQASSPRPYTSTSGLLSGRSSA